MIRKSKLIALMAESLPNLSSQKKLLYRTTLAEVVELYHTINDEIFDNKLPIPEIQVVPRCRQYWGYCFAKEPEPIHKTESNCILRLSDKWYCKQWLITILAHEMCHQYQWDIDSHERLKYGHEPLMSHGPSFFKYKAKLANVGISLRRAHGNSAWFKHQNLFK